ncbi:MAG: hypothetical protein H0V96_01120 [Acidimicrobiia bacterium]|nr:hypothetical protein [Acidimicrobiia bacterium]
MVGGAAGRDPGDGDPLLPGTPAGDDLADLSRLGARRYDREMAEAEDEAERFRLRGRTVVDTLWEAMNEGDTVTVILGARRLVGSLLAARYDLAILQLPDATAAVRVGAIDAVSLGPPGDGVPGDRSFGSFFAYLRMLELEALEVSVLGEGIEVVGQILAVTPDHLLMRSRPGTRWMVPLRAVDAVVRRR